MAYFYEHCGRQFLDVRQLASGTCFYHPAGCNCRRHKLYEGRSTEPYTCKYCGRTFSSLMQMVTAPCAYHPNGRNKGKHAPAL